MSDQEAGFLAFLTQESTLAWNTVISEILTFSDLLGLGYIASSEVGANSMLWNTLSSQGLLYWQSGMPQL